MDENDRRRRLRPGDLPGDPYFERAASMDRFEQICWLWAKTDRAIHDALERHPRTLRVKYEDIFKPERKHCGFAEIIDFLDLRSRIEIPFDEITQRMAVRRNETSRHELAAWDDWSDEQRASFIHIAGEHMKRCGYELDR